MDQPPRPRFSSLFALPLALGVLLAVAVVGLLVAGWIGRPAGGGRVTIEVTSDCPDAWAERIEARGDSVGLGEPVRSIRGDVVTYTATYPGLDDDMTAMPRLLTAPGVIAVLAGEGGETLATRADISEVHLSTDLRVHPRVELVFTPEAEARLIEYSRGPAPGEGQPVVVTLDGEVIEIFQDPRGWAGAEFDLQPELETLTDEIRSAVDWNILLRHGEGPCEVTNLEVAAAAGP